MYFLALNPNPRSKKRNIEFANHQLSIIHENEKSQNIRVTVYMQVSQKKYVIFEVQKCQFSKLGANMQNPIFSKLYILKCQKKSVPTIFFKSIFFMGTSIGLNLLTFFNFFAFKKKKFHFTSENRARTAKLSVPMD